MVDATNGRCVYYALNDSGQYLMYARQSIRSLRRYNSTIPVRVFVYGTCPAETKQFLSQHDAELTELPEAEGKLTFLKWWALEHLTADRHLFADADTIFYKDVDLLFESCRDRDFYAREEGATAADSGEQDYDFPDPVEFLDLPFAVRSLRQNGSGIHEETLRQITDQLGVERIPIFNTGVMLFNNGTHARIAELLPQFASLSADFGSGKIPYPATNPHLIDEVVASLVLSGIPGLSHGLLRMKECPFYLELRANLCDDPGIVMHLFAAYYWDYLKHHGDDAQRDEFSRHVRLSRLRYRRWKAYVASTRAMAVAGLRLRRARSSIRGDQYARGVARARAVADTDMTFAYSGLRSLVSGRVSYGAVDVLCEAICAAGDDPALDEEERENRISEYAAAAARILGNLSKAGYFRSDRRRDGLSSDARLEPLRERQEFRRFMSRFEAGRARPC